MLCERNVACGARTPWACAWRAWTKEPYCGMLAIVPLGKRVKYLRFALIAWLSLWLGAVNAYAIVMPQCKHGLDDSAAAQHNGNAAAHQHHHHSHQDMVVGAHGQQRDSNESHEPRASGSGMLDCDGCGLCHVICSPFTAMSPVGFVVSSHEVFSPVAASQFRPGSNDRLFHPPRI
jgi:Protein of unknown function (DUF2946)